MNIPENLKYTRSHEWVEFLPDGRVDMKACGWVGENEE